MKKLITLIAAGIFTMQIYSQNIIVDFLGEILETQTPVTLDSVQIENLTKVSSITISGNSSINLTTGYIVTVPMFDEYSTILVYPNPFSTSSKIDFYVKDKENVNIAIVDITGRLIAVWNEELPREAIVANFSLRVLESFSSLFIWMKQPLLQK